MPTVNAPRPVVCHPQTAGEKCGLGLTTDLGGCIFRHMARIARVVMPDCFFHIMQRGNRRMETFFCDDDFAEHIDLMAREAPTRLTPAPLHFSTREAACRGGGSHVEGGGLPLAGCPRLRSTTRPAENGTGSGVPVPVFLRGSDEASCPHIGGKHRGAHLHRPETRIRQRSPQNRAVSAVFSVRFTAEALTPILGARCAVPPVNQIGRTDEPPAHPSESRLGQPCYVLITGGTPVPRKAASCRRTPKAEAAACHDSPSWASRPSWCRKGSKEKEFNHGWTRINADYD
jgi:hypothetical protein